MKLVRYGKSGREIAGFIDADGLLRPLTTEMRRCLPPMLQWWVESTGSPEEGQASVPAGTRIGACVAGTRNFIAVGLNYSEHARESGAAIPLEPILFNKAPSCIVGPGDDIEAPPGSTKLDWEVELAVVIGRSGFCVDEQDVAEIVAGYCICNDVSERAFQLERGGQWMKGKGCPTFGPLGPWLVTPDELGDVQSLDLWLDVNGAPRQRGNTRTMIFPVRHLVAYISRFMKLEPGDVITTGTPAGVGLGMSPPLYLKPGDLIELGIQGLGVQRQRVVAGRVGPERLHEHR